MKTTIFTAGCFDGGLHSGHLKLLREARALGELLIVSINRDEYLAKKGPGRPILKEADRVRSLYQTGLVDEVVVHDSSPLEWVLYFKPNYIVVGDDYTEETTVGAKEAKEWGGKVHFVKKIPGVSTTALIGKTYIIQLHDHDPSGDWTPFVLSIDKSEDWGWLHSDGTGAYQFESRNIAQKWADSQDWLSRRIGTIKGYSIIES